MRARVMSSRTASGSAPITRRRSPLRLRRGHARSRTGKPLRGSWRPRKTIRFSRPAGSRSGGNSTPFGISSYSPGVCATAARNAWLETAIFRSRRSATKPKIASANGRHDELPAAWNVPTAGPFHIASAAGLMTGASGSCTWSRSNPSVCEHAPQPRQRRSG